MSTRSNRRAQPGEAGTSQAGEHEVSTRSNQPGSTRSTHPKDVRKNPPIPFEGVEAGVSPIYCPVSDEPCEAFMSIMDNEVIEHLCRWTNERAAIYFVGKRKKMVNGLL